MVPPGRRELLQTLGKCDSHRIRIFGRLGVLLDLSTVKCTVLHYCALLVGCGCLLLLVIRVNHVLVYLCVQPTYIHMYMYISQCWPCKLVYGVY